MCEIKQNLICQSIEPNFDKTKVCRKDTFLIDISKVPLEHDAIQIIGWYLQNIEVPGILF